MILAADLLKSSHPLHNSFVAWCRGKGIPPSRRQAVKFLEARPFYNEVRAA